MINGYLRSDGRKGIRNIIVVTYLVECAHHVAREIVHPFREQGRPSDRLFGLLSQRLLAQDDGAAVHASQRRRGAAGLARLRGLQQGRPARDDPAVGTSRAARRDPGHRRHAQDHRRGPGVDRADAPATREHTARGHGHRRADRRHDLRRLRRDVAASPRIRRWAVPSTFSSSRRRRASSRRPAS